jgi:hypothetical protein
LRSQSGHDGLLKPLPRYHRSVIRGYCPGLAKSGRPLRCPSRTLHVSHERVSFTFPNCYAVDNGPGSAGHRVSSLFHIDGERVRAGRSIWHRNAPSGAARAARAGPARARSAAGLIGHRTTGPGARLTLPQVTNMVREPAGPGPARTRWPGPPGADAPVTATGRDHPLALRRARCARSPSRPGRRPTPPLIDHIHPASSGRAVEQAAGRRAVPLPSRSRNSRAGGLSQPRRRNTLGMSRLVSAYPGQAKSAALD